jgi:hypothetical protein
VKAPGGMPVELPARRRTSMIEKWRARVAATYPAECARLLLEDSDPFRNPFGRVLRERLPVLVDELTGAMDWSRIRPALDEIVRVRAVQDFSASQAAGFLVPLKRVIREELDPDPATAALLDQRIDEMLLAAFDIYVECREKIREIQVEAAKRRVFVLEKMAAGR